MNTDENLHYLWLTADDDNMVVCCYCLRVMQRWAATTFCWLQETERKREAFYELLAHRYPEYADKITAQYGPVERVSSVYMNMCIVKLAMNAFHVVNML